VRYWDSSAIIAMLVSEPASAGVRAEHARDMEMATWWGTQVECVSALARLEREGALAPPDLVAASARLDELAAQWAEVQPTQRLRQTAVRLLRTHTLRAGDALQLAAASGVAENHPRTLPFVTRDVRLALAAEREGFAVITPS
jgi:predicted nucleic acid-binding protein